MILHPIYTPIFTALLAGLAALWWWAAVRAGEAWPPRDALAAPARAARWLVAGWRWRRRVGPLVWQPGEVRALARQLAAEREWQRRFISRRDQLIANRRLRAAGYGAALAGRVRRLP